MNFVMIIFNPQDGKKFSKIADSMKLPMAVGFRGAGTAVQSMLELLGISSTDKRIFTTVVPEEKSKELIREAKKSLYIGVPGHGFIVSVPVKSVGGGKTLSILNNGNMPEGAPPAINYAYELILAICNSGRTDMVMNAARAAGAAGGTVIHGKGTGAQGDDKFYGVSIASEKEVIFIVSEAEKKAGIMKSIIDRAGTGTEAGAIVFSLPVSEVAGFGMFED